MLNFFLVGAVKWRMRLLICSLILMHLPILSFALVRSDFSFGNLELINQEQTCRIIRANEDRLEKFIYEFITFGSRGFGELKTLLSSCNIDLKDSIAVKFKDELISGLLSILRSIPVVLVAERQRYDIRLKLAYSGNSRDYERAVASLCKLARDHVYQPGVRLIFVNSRDSQTECRTY